MNRMCNVEELLPALYEIGSKKNKLPVKLQGWVNSLDLYVQLRDTQLLTSSFESLVVGGKYLGYFIAHCDYPDNESWIRSHAFGDFSRWEINKFRQQIWEKRFARLVEPTSEIVSYLYIPDKNNPTRTYGSKSDIEKYESELIPKLDNAVKRFQLTGEWIGLHDYRCLSCGQDISWWTYFHSDPCPRCSGKVRKTRDIRFYSPQ